MLNVDYEKIHREKMKENLKKIKIDKSMEAKIRNFSKKSGYSQKEIIKKIKTDDVFVWFFIKDPIRQNFTEIATQEYIERLDTVTDFRKLGTQDMYVTNGGMYAFRSYENSCLNVPKF